MFNGIIFTKKILLNEIFKDQDSSKFTGELDNVEYGNRRDKSQLLNSYFGFQKDWFVIYN